MDRQIDPRLDRPLGARAAAKARTRKSLIAAAKRLFMERGYEGATIRDIAGAANLSTGAVFASFADKAALFNEVLLADSDVQIQRMTAAAAEPGEVRERVTRLLAAGYGYQLAQIELLRAALAVSWSQGLSGDLGDRPIRDGALQAIREVIQEGVERGELARDCQVDLMVETIWECFVGNYRHALFSGHGLEQLTDRVRRQIRLLMDGA
jgi:AcrR family transcriptional regulator